MKRIVSVVLGVFLGASCSLRSAPAPAAGEEFPPAPPHGEQNPNSEFILNVWQTRDGLPVNVIEDMCQTPDGFLWLGTQQGLVRFDGLRFQAFLTAPTGSRYGARVAPLEVDGRGRLWVAPDQIGLMHLQAGAFTEVLTNGDHLRARVRSLCRDGADGLRWVDATGGAGVLSTTPPYRAERWGDDAGSGWRWVHDVAGAWWLVGTRSIRLYEGSRWRLVEPGGPTLVAAPHQQGGLWVARQAHLHWLRTNGPAREVVTFPWRGGGNRVTCLLEDRHHRLWVGTATQGLFCYASGRFQQVFATASSILCLFEDPEDNLWVGTRGAGLVRVRQRQFFMLDQRSGLENEFVRSLAQDLAGRVWLVSSERGVGWWQNGEWHKAGPAEGWPGYAAACVLPAKDGAVWLSTLRHGLWRYANGKFKPFEVGPAPPRETPVDLLEDRQGRLWMVTDNVGLYCLEGHQLTSYSTAQGLPSDHIRALAEDEAGQLWAGDWEGALARRREDRWEVVRPPSGHGDPARSLVAAEGALWMGTSAGGLLRFKNGQTTRLSVEQGLPDACVQQLLFDGRGELWGTTPDRVFRVPLAQVNAVLDGRQERLTPVIYGHSDGLPDVFFVNWCDPRCWQTTENELWFATANGALHFLPARLRESLPPQTLIEQTLLEQKPVAASTLAHLRPDSGRLEFRFTAPCFTAADRVRFRYALSGVDPEWRDAGTSRSAVYTALPAGAHTFRVQAASPDGVWSTHTATVALAVYPYFWQTNWFLAALAAGAAGGGVWTVRRATVRRLQGRLERLHHQHALEQERARIAQDIHDELGANLTSIGLLADLGARHQADPAALTHDLDQISHTARESVAAMDAIVWALNPRNDSLDHFANYLAQFTRDFFRPTGLRTRLELPADLPECRMTAEVRHQLFLLVKEAFNNVVRHAQANEVRLELAIQDGSLRLTIADDGQGLGEPTLPGSGQDGLTNLRERIARLGGTLCLQSAPGQGTRLDFSLPLPKLRANSLN